MEPNDGSLPNPHQDCEGFPTKKCITELMLFHGVVYRALDLYARNHRVHWSNKYSNAPMEVVATALRDAGIECTVEAYGLKPGMAGCLTIKEKK